MQKLRRGATMWVAATLAIVSACASPSQERLDEAARTTAYVGGFWYDGASYIERDAYVRDGVFVGRPHGQPGQVVDLAGGFVTPAFAEGHHHTVICEPGRIGQFIDAGILYAAIMAASASTEACRSRLHGDGSVEIVSAQASITAPDAHPTQIGLYWLAPEQVDGEWVYHADDSADVARAFALISERHPDFIKVFLSYSEDHARLRDDPTMSSWYRGLDPSLVQPIVERAHASGLRVAAHVMTGHDFAVAVNAGVDIIAHTPGFAPGAAFTEESHPYLEGLTPDSQRYRITPADARRAATAGVVVVTTLGREPGAAAAANIDLLREAGVRILIGSDRGEGNSVGEAIDLVHDGVMSPSEAVRSLSVTTPRYFFPNRRIGELHEGAEATFVVLRGDPTRDINALRDPRIVVQRGAQLRPVR
jgi:imidazolonepropionase-like amidohydrolase